VSPDGSVELAVVDEDWNFWQGVFADIPFELTGLARLRIEITEQSNGPVISFTFHNESGTFPAPSNLGADWDHFIVNGTLVPIRSWELESAYSIIAECGIRLGVPTGLASLFRLMTRAREAGLPLHAPENFESLSKFEPKAGQLEGFTATTYPYQSTGIDWLTDYFDNSLGMMLCDEMGLGKTVQAIGLIAHAINVGAERVLIVAPASLVPNWQRELSNFLPSQDFVEHLGPSRAATPGQLAATPLLITSYQTLIKDLDLLSSQNFDLIIADEAQWVKNFRSKSHSALAGLPGNCKLLMTGTPLENRLGELVSLVDLVSPGLLGPLEQFENLLHDDPELARDLGSLASPLILRRRVANVAQDLPELIDIPTPIRPTKSWARAYNAKLTEDASLLAKYTSLTQICCSPALLDSSYVDPETRDSLQSTMEPSVGGSSNCKSVSTWSVEAGSCSQVFLFGNTGGRDSRST
jgi:SNF2 family DNA or RNA helicase